MHTGHHNLQHVHGVGTACCIPKHGVTHPTSAIGCQVQTSENHATCRQERSKALVQVRQNTPFHVPSAAVPRKLQAVVSRPKHNTPIQAPDR